MDGESMGRKYKYELHSHTSEVSGCAEVSAAGSYRLHEAAGYDGIVVTDHFYTDALNDRYSHVWSERSYGFMTGYRNMKSVAREGFDVLFGLEFRFHDSPNDYLVFGITPELFSATPDIDLYDHAQLREFADKNGLIIAQAHPFRGTCTPDAPEFLDGMEVYNGHPWHAEHNDRALAYAEKYGLIKTSGSDFHHPGMLARGGIVTDSPIRNERDLVDVLRSGNYELIRTLTSYAE